LRARATALRRPRLDEPALLAATVSPALFDNAVVCAVISGPRDRYGAQMAWIATLVVLIAAIRHFSPTATSRLAIHFRRERKFSTPVL
jgi:hypothetical protein